MVRTIRTIRTIWIQMVQLVCSGWGRSAVEAAEGGENRAADLGRVGSVEVLVVGRRSGPRLWRRREREDLEAGPVVGDEVLLDQPIAGLDVGVEGQLQKRAQFVVVVETLAAPVAREDQQHVEPQLVRGQRGEESLPQEAVGNEGEALTPDAPDSVWTNRRTP